MAAAIMSVAAMAGNRSTSSTLPANTPSVNVTVDGKSKAVKPDHVAIVEKDATHTEITISAKKDKATVSVPVGYNTVMDWAMKAAELLKVCGLMNNDDYQKCIYWYEHQIGADL